MKQPLSVVANKKARMKKERFDSWFNGGCSFRMQFEEAASAYIHPSHKKTQQATWTTVDKVDKSLIRMYGQGGKMKKNPDIGDLIFLWEYCAKEDIKTMKDQKDHKLLFFWFARLAYAFAKTAKWATPSFKDTDAAAVLSREGKITH